MPVISNQSQSNDNIGHSGISYWRAAVLIGVNLLIIAHIIQWQIMGTTVTPIEPSEAMHTIQTGAVNAGFIFFSLAILATLIFGRFVCGWACHIVALQDLCGWLLTKIGLKPKPFRSRLLIYIPLLTALYMFVWPTVLKFFIKPVEEPLFPQFTNHLITTDFWATFPPVWVAIPFLFICGFMTVYFLGSKGFCTYGCPYGGFFAIADKVAPGKIRVTDDCNQCGHCTAVCTSNVLVHAEVNKYGMVVDQGCMKCMDCVSVCPNDALYFGFGKPSAVVQKTIKTNYSITWAEEIAGVIVFFASLFAVWNVYQLVPMLMAIGIAIITTFLVLRSWRIVNKANVAFYRFSLSSPSKINKAGWLFLAFTLVWGGFNIHSGWIHFHESKGTRAYEQLQIPDELALAQADPIQWLSPIDVQNSQIGIKHLQTAADHGLFVNHDALPKLAWMYFLTGDSGKAVEMLENASLHKSGQSKALSLYYRGAILNRSGEYEKALVSLTEASIERPDLLAAKEEQGLSLWKLDRRNEAVKLWREITNANPALPVSSNFLAGAFYELNDPSSAAEYERQADRYTLNDPYFHWMLGLRLFDAGMYPLAEKHFAQAVKLNPAFTLRRKDLKKPQKP